MNGGNSDLFARILAVVLAGIVTLWTGFASRDRFTGEDAAVLETRVSQLEKHVSAEGQKAAHENINDRISRQERYYEDMKKRIRALERHVDSCTACSAPLEQR